MLLFGELTADSWDLVEIKCFVEREDGDISGDRFGDENAVGWIAVMTR